MGTVRSLGLGHILAPGRGLSLARPSPARWVPGLGRGGSGVSQPRRGMRQHVRVRGCVCCCSGFYANMLICFHFVVFFLSQDNWVSLKSWRGADYSCLDGALVGLGPCLLPPAVKAVAGGAFRDAWSCHWVLGTLVGRGWGRQDILGAPSFPPPRQHHISEGYKSCPQTSFLCSVC